MKHVRLADYGDLLECHEIYKKAKKRMEKDKIPQWTGAYPSDKDLNKDVEEKNCYVFEKKGEIRGVMALIFEEEPTYANIDGVWLTDGPYATIHRIAVKKPGSGVAEDMLDFAQALAVKKGCRSLRVDTHEYNRPMRRFLSKNAFDCCGVVELADGSKRRAYEKPLKRHKK